MKSDDCIVVVNGEPCAVHEGESVWLFVGQSVGELRALSRLAGLQGLIDGAKGENDPAAAQGVLAGIDGAFEDICAMLAPRVVRWTWTDFAGRPMPQPDGKPETLARLETEELFWLLQAARGEGGGGRANFSKR